MSDESVFRLVEQEKAVPLKGARFQSQRAPNPTASTFGFHGTSVVLANVQGEPALTSAHPAKKEKATFGRTVADSIEPNTFLKKSQKPPPEKHAATALHDKRKAPIPDRSEKPVMGLKTDKNFVVANAVENILSIAKKQPPTNNGRAVDKEDYGKVPDYIHKVKADLKSQYAMVDSYKQRKAQEEEKFAQLSQAEVAELRAGLQRRWEVLNKQFQTMGFSVETYSQKRHQEQVESELRAVEAALQKVNKPTIFVFDDSK